MNPEASSFNCGRVAVILNSKSGGYRETILNLLDKQFGDQGAGGRVVRLIDEEDHSDTIIREAIDDGAELIVAAGGDGTVATVASALIRFGRDLPLGILPLGTANVLARELGLPTDPVLACSILSGPLQTRSLDVMRVEDHRYFTQVGVGLDSLMIQETDTSSKQRFGRSAYLWSGIRHLVGFQPRRFVIQIDDEPARVVSASQVLVANVGTLGQPPFRWAPDIRPDDGFLNLCLIRTQSLWDTCGIAWRILRGHREPDPSRSTYRIQQKVTIGLRNRRHPLPVQADGEIIGETPVEIQLEKSAIRVVVQANPS